MFLNMNPVLISIGGFEIKYYSLMILLGVILSISLFMKEGKRFGINSDFLFNLAFWIVVMGIIGARLYYVLFNLPMYKNDPMSIFKIWEGGLAIHGGIIFGILTILVYCRRYKVDVLRILDMLSVPLLLAQAIGRWGNFFNNEAHGAVTTLEHLRSLHIPDFIINGMQIDGLYYEPTFLYESLWCLMGFLIVLIIRRNKYIKRGGPTAFYFMWYGVGRFFIESMRTDSLMIGGFKMAQVVSIIMFVVGLGMTMILTRKGKFEDLYNTEQESMVQF
jgi:phosphatidylglycerol---prolipoprotein diacylglyceryl transferase